ncbi:BlaI/MecI/CopY family transcriptional regulator [uncultured Subdoligranulum sp.]|uniref:BlaI/MecI/CopY family transcriptional regulator n=1 Tax=uncultured Subdoligranulum sp. TaxID=512298 RepID=UPI003208E707
MHLTKSEQQIMEIFWQADHPMAQTEVVSTCVDRKWKERSIFSMLNSLMEKGVLKEVGFVRSGKTYARTFEPAMSHAEYLAEVIVEQLPADQFPGLLAALLKRVEITPAIQKELRAAVRENGQ